MPNFPSRLFGKRIAITSTVLLLWLFTHMVVAEAETQHQTIPTMPPPSATTMPTSSVSDTPTKQAPTGTKPTQATGTLRNPTTPATLGSPIGVETSTPAIVTNATATPRGVLLPQILPSPLLTYTVTASPVPYIEPVEKPFNKSLTYLLIGLGIILLTVVIVWLWSKRRISK